MRQACRTEREKKINRQKPLHFKHRRRPLERTAYDFKPLERTAYDCKPSERTPYDFKPSERTAYDLNPSERRTAYDFKPSESTAYDFKPLGRRSAATSPLDIPTTTSAMQSSQPCYTLEEDTGADDKPKKVYFFPFTSFLTHDIEFKK